MHILFDSAVPILGVYSTDIFTRAKSWMCRVIYCSSSCNSQRLEQSKSLSETNVMYNTYVQALEKMVPVNLCVWHKRGADRRTDSWTQWGKEREGWTGRVAVRHIQTASGNLLSDTGAQPGALGQPRGVGQGGRWGGGSGVKGHRYTYGWFMLMFGRNQHNIIKRLSSNSK